MAPSIGEELSTGKELPSAEELSELTREAMGRSAKNAELSGATAVTSPITGTTIAHVNWASRPHVDEAVEKAQKAFRTWRTTPAPVRGALVKRFGELLKDHKDDLATLVSLEAGKITSEARGEVQEMIDVCEFAVGLSRQLYGKTMSSERPAHRLMETWHPLGVAGVISAFNFPVAVWSWNAAIALVCGDPVIWKPSESTPHPAAAMGALPGRIFCHGPPGRSLRPERLRALLASDRMRSRNSWVPCSPRSMTARSMLARTGSPGKNGLIT